MSLSKVLRTGLVLIGVVILTGACTPQTETEPDRAELPELTGPYLGQQPPGLEPVVFAPGFVTTGLATRDVAMTPDGSELYFGVFFGNRALIMVTKADDNGRWSEPQVAAFSGRYRDIEPHISPDGSQLFFLSTRPKEGQPEKPGWAYQDIWVCDRIGDGWGEPYNLGPPVNTDGAEFYPSTTRDGTIYFTRGEANDAAIYRARRLEGGGYQEPEKLPEQVNCGDAHYNAFIAPDESYIIVCVNGRDDSIGGSDYYVVFRSPDDTWSEPVNMGETINTDGGGEWSPYVSPDGKYFFFMSSRSSEQLSGSLAGRTISELLTWQAEPQNGASDIYWVDAAIIESLRPESAG
jgi:hypothetical protein